MRRHDKSQQHQQSLKELGFDHEGLALGAPSANLFLETLKDIGTSFRSLDDARLQSRQDSSFRN